MQIRAAIALQAVLKSMTDVMLPAIDPENKLAQEQSRLIIGLLALVADRLPLQRAYDLDELRRLCSLAHVLQSIEPVASLSVAAENGAEAITRQSAATSDLVTAIGMLTEAIGDRAQTLAGRSDESSRAGCLAVLASAREQQLRERSWLLMQGWEVDAAGIPAIDELIGL
jgi:hypothetical protein